MRREAGYLLAVGFDGTHLPGSVVALAEQSGLGGVVLFTRNCPSLETVLALTAEARRLDPDLLVMVDHEGGRVHRLPPPFTRFPPAAAVGRSGDPRLARDVGQALARNPFPIVVPCHRVVAAGGKLGGFSARGGVVTKQRLLAIERANVSWQLPLHA